MVRTREQHIDWYADQLARKHVELERARTDEAAKTSDEGAGEDCEFHASEAGLTVEAYCQAQFWEAKNRFANALIDLDQDMLDAMLALKAGE